MRSRVQCLWLNERYRPHCLSGLCVDGTSLDHKMVALNALALLFNRQNLSSCDLVSCRSLQLSLPNLQLQTALSPSQLPLSPWSYTVHAGSDQFTFVAQEISPLQNLCPLSTDFCYLDWWAGLKSSHSCEQSHFSSPSVIIKVWIFTLFMSYPDSLSVTQEESFLWHSH